MTGQDWLEKDFYAVLGVPKDADATTIKKAYRKLARSMHPDHNPGDAAAEAKFKEIGEAYAVLSDTEQRQQYDQLRAMAGGARFTQGDPITMTAGDIARVAEHAPGAHIVAVHLEAINHCVETRADLHQRLRDAGLQEHVTVPEDGALVPL